MFWTGPIGVQDVLVACDYQILIKILGVATFSVIIFGLDIEFESLGPQTEVVQCNCDYPDLVYPAP